MTDKPYHILITRLSAIGDCVLTLPMATAIKRVMPEARITWGVSCAARQLIELCPDVDEVVHISKRWIKEPRQWSALRRRFRESTIDCAIDPQSLTKSSMLGWLSGAPVRIGFAKRQGRELSPLLNTISLPSDNLHLADAQLGLLQPLGITPGKGEFRLEIPQPVQQWADDLLRSLVGTPAPVVINPGAGWDSRLWPTERFASVASWLHKAYRLPTLVVWAGDREREFAAEICHGAPNAAIMAPDTNLVQLAALLGRANTFLSSDTGPMHVAAAMGTRCVSLHGPTNPGQSGPYGDQHLSIRKVNFDGSSRVRRAADNWSMKEIQVSEVCQLMERMLQRKLPDFQAA